MLTKPTRSPPLLTSATIRIVPFVGFFAAGHGRIDGYLLQDWVANALTNAYSAEFSAAKPSILRYRCRNLAFRCRNSAEALPKVNYITYFKTLLSSCAKTTIPPALHLRRVACGASKSSRLRRKPACIG
jgi:hypothetical protein